MKKVVVLQGQPKSGKTPILKSALCVLAEKRARVKAHYRWRGELPVIDVWAILDVCGKNVFFSTADGAKRGIEEQFAEALECAELSKEQIDVFVFSVCDTRKGKRLLETIVARIGTENTTVLQKGAVTLQTEQSGEKEEKAAAEAVAEAVIDAARNGDRAKGGY